MTFQSEFKPLKQVLLKQVQDAFESQAVVDAQWQNLHFEARPHFKRACDEYQAFIQLLSSLEVEPLFLPSQAGLGLDSLYPRDAAITCNSGVILCQMGKPARGGEPEAMGAFLKEQGFSIRGRIRGEGRVEGGDVAWVDERTLAVGRGYRTNDEGIRQLRALLGEDIDQLLEVPLPHWRGPDDVFHLMSVFSPVDKDLAVVYSPLMPVPFRQELLARGYRLVEVPEQEFAGLGSNVLSVAPGVCLMVRGNPVTRQRLLDAGAQVYEFSGQEICLKGCGGPTCLTRPLSRT